MTARAWAALLIPAAASATPLPAPPTDDPIQIAAVGDILFGRYRRSKRYRPTTTVLDPFAFVRPLLSTADIAFGNVESPVMDEPARFGVWKSYTFRADPRAAAVLFGAGFDVVSIANNHMTNFGDGAPSTTRRHLAAAGLLPIGAGADTAEAYRPAVIDARGRRLAFLAFTTITNGRRTVTPTGAIAHTGSRGLLKKAVPAIRAARAAGADFVVVSIHWGHERAPHPGTWQRRAARALVRAGADLVLGHHPHVVQDFERIGRGFVAYSLGNFLFSNRSAAQRRSVVLRASLLGQGESRRVGRVELVPIWAGTDHAPRPATGRRYHQWRRTLATLARTAEIAPARTQRARALAKTRSR